MTIRGAEVLGAIVALGLLLACAYSAAYLYHYGALDIENVILGADPFMRSHAFAFGYGERSLIHPNLSNFVNPPIRILAVFGGYFADIPAKEIQMRVALWVSPICTGLATYMMLLVTLRAGLRPMVGLALAILYGFSISSLGYGSVPDHFMISAFLLTVAVWLFLVDAEFPARYRIIAWTTLVTLVAGITISNAIPVMAIFACSEYKRQTARTAALPQIARQAGLVGVHALVLTLVSWAVLSWVYKDLSAIGEQAYEKHIGRIFLHTSHSPLHDFLAFPFTVGQAFWGGKPDLESNIIDDPLFVNAKYKVMFMYNPPFHGVSWTWLVWLAPCLVLGVSIFKGLRPGSDLVQRAALSSLIILAFNWALHSVWGSELILFSPHWHLASVVGLIPLISTFPDRPWVDSMIVSLAIAFALLNLHVWNDILKAIPGLAS